MPLYHDKAVLITGASSGIGEACALHLDGLGFTVFAGVRREEDADMLKTRASSRLTPVILDVTDENTITQARYTLETALPETGLWGLVNNAGLVVGGPLEVLPLEELRKQLEVNVIGQVAVAKAFTPLLRQARGRLVNMGSIAGRSALPFLGPYSASKFALAALTDALRMELKPWGIAVSLIEPGSIKTPIWEKSLGHAASLRKALPRELESLYSTAMDRMEEASRRSALRGVSTEHVVRCVVHALTNPRPKTHYLVGRDAVLRALLNGLPAWVKDWLILTRLGLHIRHG